MKDKESRSGKKAKAKKAGTARSRSKEVATATVRKQQAEKRWYMEGNACHGNRRQKSLCQRSGFFRMEDGRIMKKRKEKYSLGIFLDRQGRKRGRARKRNVGMGILLAVAMVLDMLPFGWLRVGVLAAADVPVTADVAAGDVVINRMSSQIITFTADQCSSSCQGHAITQNVSVARYTTILVESGTHNITFSGLNLTTAMVGVMPGATMNLTITDSNTIKGKRAGIYVLVGATLVITEQSTGSLDVSGNASGAGIGGSYYIADPANPDEDRQGDLNCGTVIINGGIITATGGSCSAGIGGAGGDDNTPGGNGGTVTINGGTVTATGGDDTGDYGGAGIGGGIYNSRSGSGGTLTINGGLVTLDVGTRNGQWGIAYGFGRGRGSNSNAGTLTLAEESCLTLANGTTLDPDGTYRITSNPTADMLTVPSDMHYTSADMAAEIAQKVTLSGKEICGQTFQIDMEGWSLSITKKSDLEYTAIYTHAEKGSVSKPVIILPCLHGDGAALTHHEKEEADCTHTGILEYWDCSVCMKKFSDKDGQTEIADTEIPMTSHTLTHHEETEADCTQAGNVEYWDCSVCGKKFSDQDGQTEISDADVEIKRNPHTLTHHARVEAGCLTEGNMEYWNCSVCNKLFSDKDGMEEAADVKIPAAGHKYSDWQSGGNGTHTHHCQILGCGFAETENCSGGTASYTEKPVCEVCGGAYGEVLKDTGAPTGEISIRTNKWNGFLDTITFGLFFKETEQVTVTGEDPESGVASIAYYISKNGMPEEDVKALTEEWTVVNGDTVAFGIGREGSGVVYAKITDYQGNVTYLSSDGMVFDGTLPSITGVVDGETYCTPQEVTVTDENLESVVVNGKEETLPEGEKIWSFVLDILSGRQTITVRDKAGNTVTLTVNMEHRYGMEWKSDEKEHWHECDICGDRSDVAVHTEDDGSVTKAPTETEMGIQTYWCSVCKYELRTEEIGKLPPSHTHEYGIEWKSDENNHWHECVCGEKSEVAAHMEDEGSVTKAPTTTETGIRTYRCSVCGYGMRTEEIAKLPQNPDSGSSGSGSGGETSGDSGSGSGGGTGGDSGSSSGGDSGSGSGGETGGDSGNGSGSGTGSGSETPEVPDTPPTKPGEGSGTETTPTDPGTETKPTKPGTGDTTKPETGDASKPEGGTTDKPETGDASEPENGDTSKPETGDADTSKPESGTDKETDTETDTPQESTPESDKMPFLKGQDGKTGWDVIRAEEKNAENGNTINVDMNGSATVPGDIFDRLKGRDVSISFDMGNNILWNVNGKSIEADQANDIDFSVTTGGNNIPEDVVARVTKENNSIQLSLAHEGTFGFCAVLYIPLGRDNAGRNASLYYYNESVEELEWIGTSEIAEDGVASIVFDHASDYVIVIHKRAGDSDSTAEDGTSGEGSTAAEGGKPGDGNTTTEDGASGEDSTAAAGEKTGDGNTAAEDGASEESSAAMEDEKTGAGDTATKDIPPEETDKTSENDKTTDALPQTGLAWESWWFAVLGALMVLMGVCVFFMEEKKEKNERHI